MTKARIKALSVLAALMAVIGLTASPSHAATQTVNCNNQVVNNVGCTGPVLPTALSPGSTRIFNGVTTRTTGVTEVCTTFTTTGTGTFRVSFYGESSSAIYTSPGTNTYCSSGSTALLYAANGREVPVFTGISGNVTITAVSITVISAGSTG